MTQSSDLDRLNAAIEALEAKLTAYRSLREVLANKEIANEVRGFFSANGAAATPKGQKSKIMQKIEEFFAKTGNEWATIDEMVTGTRIKRESLRQAIYKGHKERFERDSHPGGGRPSRFRLKEEK